MGHTEVGLGGVERVFAVAQSAGRGAIVLVLWCDIAITRSRPQHQIRNLSPEAERGVIGAIDAGQIGNFELDERPL